MFVMVLVIFGFQLADQLLIGTDQVISTADPVMPLTEELQPVYMAINIGDVEFRPLVSLRSDLAISPDGTLLTYTARNDGIVRLYLRDLSNSQSKILVTGEDGNTYPVAPTFSPTGEEVLYFNFSTNDLKAVPIDGGRPETITSVANNGLGANWLSDRAIVFTHSIDGSLHSINRGDTESQRLTTPSASGEFHTWPEVSSNGEWIFYTAVIPSTYDEARIEAYNIATGEVKTLIDRGYNARYAQSGHLVFMRGGDLWAVPINESLAEAIGTETRIEVRIEHLNTFGKAAYSRPR